jgi:host factor-I protein
MAVAAHLQACDLDRDARAFAGSLGIEKNFEERKSALLQEIFLTAVRKSHEPVTMFLVNGVMLQGEIAAFDLFCMLLRRDGLSQLVYKHAISTVQPNSPLNLADVDGDGDDD